MKHLIFGLIVLGMTNLVIAQNEITMVSNTLDRGPSKMNYAKKTAFEKTFENKKLPVVVEKMHSMVAAFDIKSLDIYTPHETENYNVKFDEGNYMIEANYNDSGTLISSKEEFKNIPLPFSVSQNIAKNHPGWVINATTCKIIYENSEITKLTCKVTLKKGDEEKTIQINS